MIHLKIAQVLGLPRYEIEKFFRIHGLKARPVGGVKKDLDPQEVYRICIEEGRTKKEAAEILGCKTTTPINRILKENDWKTPLEVKIETEIAPAEVYRLHFKERWSFIRIANHYGYESKDIISNMFNEMEWIPNPFAGRVVHEFPSDIEDEHRIEPSRTSNAFEHLEDTEVISPLDLAYCIENILTSSSESKVKWMELSSQSERYTKITEVLKENLTEVETSLNERLGISEGSKMRIRVGFVDGKLYIREQDTSDYNWMNIYENELFYFNTTEDKFRLVHEMRARLGLSTNTDLGQLIDQLTDRESAEGSGYSDLKDYQDKHIRAETLHLILDTIEQKIDDIQDRISCIGKGIGGIRNPRFPTDPETIDIMFAKFFGLGLSDGHIYRKHSQFVYAEKNPDRCKIVIQHSKNFGDVHYNEIVDNGVHRIQFSSVFGRVLRRRGFIAGDKSMQNIGLPKFIMHGSPRTLYSYFKNMWPEDGCFTTYANSIPRFTWNRTVVLRDPTKDVEYSFKSKLTDEHILFIKRYGNYESYGFQEERNGFLYLNSVILDKLVQSQIPTISRLAKDLKEIVHSTQSQLLNDEIEALYRIGIHAAKKFQRLVYHIESSRVSLSWHGKIYRKKDVMKTALLIPPDDIKKRAKVKKWIILRHKLRREVERELSHSDGTAQ
ncbi:MAG: hypothetical protein ACTSUO_09915 [Candidatus Thorarchaeota archaeon]